MANAYSVDSLLEFLEHAGERGLMPTATARALAVATRSVLEVLTEQEKSDLARLDIEATIKRFNNKRAKDFNPSSLKEYGRRVRKAISLFLQWREDPANFSVRTRTTATGRRRAKAANENDETVADPQSVPSGHPGAYNSSIAVRPGVVVTFANIPSDLSTAEAERLANFIRMLAVGA